MSGSNNQPQYQQVRSPSLESVGDSGRASIRKNHIHFPPQPQAAPYPPVPAADAPAHQPDGDAALQRLTSGAGFREPPSSHIQMNQLAVNHQDLTALYGSARYPSLDYGYSFAAANMPLLRRGLRRTMARLPSTVRPPRGDAYPVSFQPQPQLRTPTPPPHPSLPPAQGSSQGPPLPTAPHPTAATSAQPPPPAAPPTATARAPGETQLEGIQRIHGIDIDDRSRYANGTAPIPQNVQDLVAQIKGIRTNFMGFPIRVSLKELKDHFLQNGGRLKSESFLWDWYGDTRLFTRRTWYYLATDGTGHQVPV